jgi:hypothetical protein
MSGHPSVRSAFRILALSIAMVPAASLALVQPPPARADHDAYGGTQCGQLIDYRPPTASEEGLLVFHGMGPGVTADPDDPDAHLWVLAATADSPDNSPPLDLDPAVDDQLTSIAAADSFTCVTMVYLAGDCWGTGEPCTDDTNKARTLELVPTYERCGTVREEGGRLSVRDSTIASIGPDGQMLPFPQTDFVAEAGDLLDADPHLRSLVDAAASRVGEPFHGEDGMPILSCFEFRLDPDGVLESLSYSDAYRVCGTVTDGSPIGVAGVKMSTDGSSSGSVLSDRTAAVLSVAARADVEACVELRIEANRIASASPSAYVRACGYASVPGDVVVDEITMPPALFRADQLDRLSEVGAAGGTACVYVSTSGDQVSVDVADVVIPSTPVPSTATATPTPTPTATPTVTPAPVP